MKVTTSLNGPSLQDNWPGVRNWDRYEQQDAARATGKIPRWKRILDTTLIVLTAPVWLGLMILTVLLVGLVSRGPIFYRQRRIGYKGKEFMILKFRSMHVNADTRCHEGHVQSLIAGNRPMTKMDVADRRVIPGGRVMRSLCLDELPQIINVLRGEMSLVGPRPCTPREFEHYKPADKGRVEAPPGLTGPWQVNGKNKLTFSQMIELDLAYCKTMSLRQDLSIILKTIPAILGQVWESYRAKRAQ
jgi:exopolysaccharide production protein ExoY